MNFPTTCHSYPWALVRHRGDTKGKRPSSTRMAYLVGTIADPTGQAAVLTGYIMRNDMTGWTRHPRPVMRDDVIGRWRRRPSVTEVKAVKRCLPVVKG